jgi:hypothetical protein
MLEGMKRKKDCIKLNSLQRLRFEKEVLNDLLNLPFEKNLDNFRNLTETDETD